MSAFIIGALTYNLFNKINECNKLEESGSIRHLNETSSLHENFLLRNGYQRFLSEFKTKDHSVVKGEIINKLIVEES